MPCRVAIGDHIVQRNAFKIVRNRKKFLIFEIFDEFFGNFVFGQHFNDKWRGIHAPNQAENRKCDAKSLEHRPVPLFYVQNYMLGQYTMVNSGCKS